MKASDSELLSDTVSLEHEDIFKMVASLCFSGSLCVLSGKQAQSDGTSGAGMKRQGDKISLTSGVHAFRNRYGSL